MASGENHGSEHAGELKVPDLDIINELSKELISHKIPVVANEMIRERINCEPMFSSAIDNPPGIGCWNAGDSPNDSMIANLHEPMKLTPNGCQRKHIQRSDQ